MKKFLSVILAVLMMCSVPMTCFATNAKTQETIVQSETENPAIASVNNVTANKADEFSANAVEVSAKAANTALSSMLGLKQENAFGPNTSGMSFFEKIWAWIVWFFNALTGREDARVLSITVPESLGVTEGEAVEFNYKIVYKDGYENTVRPSVVIADESIIKFDYKTISSDGQTVRKTYVVGLKPGTTTITVSCDGITEACTVTVTENYYDKVKYEPTTDTLYIYENINLLTPIDWNKIFASNPKRIVVSEGVETFIFKRNVTTNKVETLILPQSIKEVTSYSNILTPYEINVFFAGSQEDWESQDRQINFGTENNMYYMEASVEAILAVERSGDSLVISNDKAFEGKVIEQSFDAFGFHNLSKFNISFSGSVTEIPECFIQDTSDSGYPEITISVGKSVKTIGKSAFNSGNITEVTYSHHLM